MKESWIKAIITPVLFSETPAWLNRNHCVVKSVTSLKLYGGWYKKQHQKNTSSGSSATFLAIEIAVLFMVYRTQCILQACFKILPAHSNINRALRNQESLFIKTYCACISGTKRTCKSYPTLRSLTKAFRGPLNCKVIERSTFCSCFSPAICWMILQDGGVQWQREQRQPRDELQLKWIPKWPKSWLRSLRRPLFPG